MDADTQFILLFFSVVGILIVSMTLVLYYINPFVNKHND